MFLFHFIFQLSVCFLILVNLRGRFSGSIISSMLSLFVVSILNSFFIKLYFFNMDFLSWLICASLFISLILIKILRVLHIKYWAAILTWLNDPLIRLRGASNLWILKEQLSVSTIATVPRAVLTSLIQIEYYRDFCLL